MSSFLPELCQAEGRYLSCLVEPCWCLKPGVERQRDIVLEERRKRDTCLSRKSCSFLKADKRAQQLPRSLTSLFLHGNAQRHHWVFYKGVTRACMAWTGDVLPCPCCQYSCAGEWALTCSDEKEKPQPQTSHPFAPPPWADHASPGTAWGDRLWGLTLCPLALFKCVVLPQRAPWETLTHPILDRATTACIYIFFKSFLRIFSLNSAQIWACFS